MKRIENYAGLLESNSECVQRLLKEWSPRSFELSERDQELELQSWLRTQLPDVPVVSQYGITRLGGDFTHEAIEEIKNSKKDLIGRLRSQQT